MAGAIQETATSPTRPYGLWELPLVARLCVNYQTQAQRCALMDPLVLTLTQKDGNCCHFHRSGNSLTEREVPHLVTRQDSHSDLADGKVKAQTLNCCLLYLDNTLDPLGYSCHH